MQHVRLVSALEQALRVREELVACSVDRGEARGARELLSILHELLQLLSHHVLIDGAVRRLADQIVAAVAEELRIFSLDTLSVGRLLVSLEHEKILLVLVDEPANRYTVNFNRALNDILHHVSILACSVLVDEENAIGSHVALDNDPGLPLVLHHNMAKLLRRQL